MCIMVADNFGLPQFAALHILLQRGLEEVHSQKNHRCLLQLGAHEADRDYNPVVAARHWIASLAFLIPPSAPLSTLPLIFFLSLQPVRYWIIGTLGRDWTHRIISLENAPIVLRGPYRFIRHPNYVVTLADTMLLPLVFGLFVLAGILTVLWSVVLRYKTYLEDDALATRGMGQSAHL